MPAAYATSQARIRTPLRSPIACRNTARQRGYASGIRRAF